MPSYPASAKGTPGLLVPASSDPLVDSISTGESDRNASSENSVEGIALPFEGGRMEYLDDDLLVLAHRLCVHEHVGIAELIAVP